MTHVTKEENQETVFSDFHRPFAGGGAGPAGDEPAFRPGEGRDGEHPEDGRLFKTGGLAVLGRGGCG